jgi:hypothetical protein
MLRRLCLDPHYFINDQMAGGGSLFLESKTIGNPPGISTIAYPS